MKVRHVLIIGLTTILLSSCARWDSRGIAYGSSAKGQLYVWKSNYSAGIGNENGSCAQGALTANANSLKIGLKAAEALDSASPDASLNFGQKVMQLNATNGQTSFANIAYFYLCQIALNDVESGKLSGAEIEQMFKSVSETAVKIKPANQTTASITQEQVSEVTTESASSLGGVESSN